MTERSDTGGAGVEKGPVVLLQREAGLHEERLPNDPRLFAIVTGLRALSDPEQLDIVRKILKHSLLDGLYVAKQADLLDRTFFFRIIDSELLQQRRDDFLSLAQAIRENIGYIDPRNRQAAEMLAVMATSDTLGEAPPLAGALSIQLAPSAAVSRLREEIDRYYQGPFELAPAPDLLRAALPLEVPSSVIGGAVSPLNRLEDPLEKGRVLLALLFPEVPQNTRLLDNPYFSLQSPRLEFHGALDPFSPMQPYGALPQLFLGLNGNSSVIGRASGLDSGLFVGQLFARRNNDNAWLLSPGLQPFYPANFIGSFGLTLLAGSSEDFKPPQISRSASSREVRVTTSGNKSNSVSLPEAERTRWERPQEPVSCHFGPNTEVRPFAIQHYLRNQRTLAASSALKSAKTGWIGDFPLELAGDLLVARREPDDHKALEKIVAAVRRSSFLDQSVAPLSDRERALPIEDRLSAMRCRMRERKEQGVNEVLDQLDKNFAGSESDVAELLALVLTEAGFDAGVGQGIVLEDGRIDLKNHVTFAWVAAVGGDGEKIAVIIDADPRSVGLNERFELKAGSGIDLSPDYRGAVRELSSDQLDVLRRLRGLDLEHVGAPALREALDRRLYCGAISMTAPNPAVSQPGEPESMMQLLKSYVDLEQAAGATDRKGAVESVAEMTRAVEPLFRAEHTLDIALALELLRRAA